MRTPPVRALRLAAGQLPRGAPRWSCASSSRRTCPRPPPSRDRVISGNGPFPWGLLSVRCRERGPITKYYRQNPDTRDPGFSSSIFILVTLFSSWSVRPQTRPRPAVSLERFPSTLSIPDLGVVLLCYALTRNLLSICIINMENPCLTSPRTWIFHFPSSFSSQVKGVAKNPLGTNPTFSAKAGVCTKSTYLPPKFYLPPFPKTENPCFKTQDY